MRVKETLRFVIAASIAISAQVACDSPTAPTPVPAGYAGEWTETTQQATAVRFSVSDANAGCTTGCQLYAKADIDRVLGLLRRRRVSERHTGAPIASHAARDEDARVRDTAIAALRRDVASLRREVSDLREAIDGLSLRMDSAARQPRWNRGR
jgi:hypothetical protein